MSTLVTVEKGGRGVIASDSLFTQGSLKVPPSLKVKPSKIFKAKDAYVGFTGWSAMMIIFENIVENCPKQLDFSSKGGVFKSFLFLHRILKKEYFLETKEKDDQPVESSQWDCLILSPAGIFNVLSYREVSQYQRFWAEGSGLRFSLGAMHATYDLHDDPEKIARAGIEAACEFDESSALPVQMYSMPLGKPKRRSLK